MLTRLSDGETKRTATDGRSWSNEAMEALLQLLVKMRPSVNIMTPQEDGSYWCDLASMFDPVKRGRSTQVVNKSSGEYHTGLLTNAYWVKNAADNDAVLGMDLMDIYSPRDPIIKTMIKLSPQTLVEIKSADWSSSRKFTKDEIAEAVHMLRLEHPEERTDWVVSSTGTAPWPPAFSAISYKPYDPPAGRGTFVGVGAKTVEGGMVPPSVKVPPAEPKPKKKWWKR